MFRRVKYRIYAEMLIREVYVSARKTQNVTCGASCDAGRKRVLEINTSHPLLT